MESTSMSFYCLVALSHIQPLKPRWVFLNWLLFIVIIVILFQFVFIQNSIITKIMTRDEDYEDNVNDNDDISHINYENNT